MSSAIALKVRFVTEGVTKTIMFQAYNSIGEGMREIECRATAPNDGSVEYGVYYPEKTKWLDLNKTFDYYDLKTGDVCEYKKKQRPLKVRLVDNSFKTVVINDSLVVKDVLEHVCKKLGIANYEEYSFCIDTSSDPNSDEGLWLKHDKRLIEQNVNETMHVTLKKKFFVSDQHINVNDPVQLNMIFLQSRLAVINGRLPCALDVAVKLAALNAQVQFGNHSICQKYDNIMSEILEFLPREYRHEKEASKSINYEYRCLNGVSEVNAKFRYVQICRSLKTYGVTFFTAKDTLWKKSKLLPVLIGISKEGIIRVDPKTKEVLKSWPLDYLWRWAPAPSSFTFDFGNMEEDYYTIDTTEGSTIASIIEGYLELVKRKREAKDISAESIQHEGVKKPSEPESKASLYDNANPRFDVPKPQTDSIPPPPPAPVAFVSQNISIPATVFSDSIDPVIDLRVRKNENSPVPQMPQTSLLDLRGSPRIKPSPNSIPNHILQDIVDMNQQESVPETEERPSSLKVFDEMDDLLNGFLAEIEDIEKENNLYSKPPVVDQKPLPPTLDQKPRPPVPVKQLPTSSNYEKQSVKPLVAPKREFKPYVPDKQIQHEEQREETLRPSVPGKPFRPAVPEKNFERDCSPQRPSVPQKPERPMVPEKVARPPVPEKVACPYVPERQVERERLPQRQESVRYAAESPISDDSDFEQPSKPVLATPKPKLDFMSELQSKMNRRNQL